MRSTLSRLGVVLGVVLTVVLVGPADVSAGPPDHAQSHIKIKKHVDRLSSLPKAHPHGSHAAAPRVGKPAPAPAHPSGPAAPVITRQSGSSTTAAAGLTTSAFSPLTAQTSPGTLEELKQFDGLGPDCCTPPDTQASVGPTKVVEMVNTTGKVTDKAGGNASTFNLSDFFGAPVNAMTSPAYSDPRVLYDALSGRWFASILIFDSCDPRPAPQGSGCTTSNDSEVDVAVSSGSEPTGWAVYVVQTYTDNTLADQPKLGASSDKVVMTWNNNGFSGPYQFVVLQKSDLLAQVSNVGTFRFVLDTNHFNVIPVISMSATNTEFAVSANQNSSTLTLSAFTGTPNANNVAVTTTDFSIGTYSSPPGAVQPNDSRTLDTGVPAVQSAVWDNGTLWAGGNDSCTPNGDSQARACLRLDRITTSGTTGTLQQDVDLGQNGAYLFYPAVMTDPGGNLFIGHSVSSSTQFGTAAMTFSPVGNLPAVVGGIDYRIGAGPYNCTFCYDTANPPNPTANRWGDYSGAARDPSNPWDIWLAEEWGSTSTTNTDAWGTAIGRFTQAPPTVTGVSPNTAPELSAACAPTVTVTGTDFVSGQTSVKFGATSASSVNVTTPESLTAVAPSHAAGTVDVTVTTPAGTSDTGAADSFTYVADTTAPTAFGSASPAPNLAGWNKTSPVTVNLSASDNSCGSGVRKITYSATGAQPIAATDVFASATTVPITTDGVTTVTFTATDNAGNTSAPQSVVVRLDTVAPSISITSPTATNYLLNQVVNAAYSCSDGTSGVASCAGPVASGSPFNTSTLGPKTFTVNAADVAGNTSSSGVTYNVAYRICLLYDPLNPPKAGNSTIAIKVRICDANGVNLSSPSITLTPSQIVGPTPRPFTTPFRYDSTLGGYIVNVSTKGLTSGNYNLLFTISGADASTHLAPFTKR